jgi:hypothetical protein
MVLGRDAALLLEKRGRRCANALFFRNFSLGAGNFSLQGGCSVAQVVYRQAGKVIAHHYGGFGPKGSKWQVIGVKHGGYVTIIRLNFQAGRGNMGASQTLFTVWGTPAKTRWRKAGEFYLRRNT